MNRSRRRSARALVIAALLVVFGLDLFVPLGVAVSVPYVAILLLSLWLGEPRNPLALAGAITVLATIGFFSPAPEGPLFGIAVQNRLIALFTLWCTANASAAGRGSASPRIEAV